MKAENENEGKLLPPIGIHVYAMKSDPPESLRAGTAVLLTETDFVQPKVSIAWHVVGICLNASDDLGSVGREAVE